MFCLDKYCWSFFAEKVFTFTLTKSGNYSNVDSVLHSINKRRKYIFFKNQILLLRLKISITCFVICSSSSPHLKEQCHPQTL